MSGLGLTFLRRGGQAHPTAGIPRIRFADPQVEHILLEKGVGNGQYISPEDAASVSSIGTWFAYSTITSFNELSYFSSITALPDQCFRGCTNLAYLTLPTNVGSFGWRALADCKGLKVLVILNEQNVISSTSNSLQGMAVSEAIYVPDNLVDSYKTASYWSGYASKFKPLSEYQG